MLDTIDEHLGYRPRCCGTEDFRPAPRETILTEDSGMRSLLMLLRALQVFPEDADLGVAGRHLVCACGDMFYRALSAAIAFREMGLDPPGHILRLVEARGLFIEDILETRMTGIYERFPEVCRLSLDWDSGDLLVLWLLDTYADQLANSGYWRSRVADALGQLTHIPAEQQHHYRGLVRNLAERGLFEPFALAASRIDGSSIPRMMEALHTGLAHTQHIGSPEVRQVVVRLLERIAREEDPSDCLSTVTPVLWCREWWEDETVQRAVEPCLRVIAQSEDTATQFLADICRSNGTSPPPASRASAFHTLFLSQSTREGNSHVLDDPVLIRWFCIVIDHMEMTGSETPKTLKHNTLAKYFQSHPSASGAVRLLRGILEYLHEVDSGVAGAVSQREIDEACPTEEAERAWLVLRRGAAFEVTRQVVGVVREHIRPVQAIIDLVPWPDPRNRVGLVLATVKRGDPTLIAAAFHAMHSEDLLRTPPEDVEELIDLLDTMPGQLPLGAVATLLNIYSTTLTKSKQHHPPRPDSTDSQRRQQLEQLILTLMKRHMCWNPDETVL